MRKPFIGPKMRPTVVNVNKGTVAVRQYTHSTHARALNRAIALSDMFGCEYHITRTAIVLDIAQKRKG